MSLKLLPSVAAGAAAALAVVAATTLFQSDAPETVAAPAAPTGLQFDDMAAFRAEVRSYLLDNPEVIMDAIEVLEVRQQEAQALSDAERVAAILPELQNDDRSWEGGNPDGDIVLVEFIDYRCSYCRRAHDEVRELVSSDGNIRIITKEFPILGEASTISSQFAVAILQLGGDEAYKAVNDQLIRLRGNPDEATLRQLAIEVGQDPEAIFAQMNAPEVTAVLRANHEMAQKLDITGTPTFVMNDQMIRGYLPLDAMRAAVAEVRG